MANHHYRSVFSSIKKDKNKITSDTREGIALVIGSLGPGGSERQLVETAKALKNNHDLDISVFCACLTSEADKFYLNDLQQADINVTALMKQSQDEPENINEEFVDLISELSPFVKSDIYDYMCTLRKLRPAIVHLWLDDVNIKGGISAVLAGVPRIILGLRSLPPIHFVFHQPYMCEGYRWLARQPEVSLVCNSKVGARSYEEWLELDAGSINVIHNGFSFNQIDLDIQPQSSNDLKSRYEIPYNKPVLGTVFRFSEEKQPMLWVKIALELHKLNPDIYFLVVGDGPLLHEVKTTVTDMNIGNRFRFTGNVTDVYQYMAMMDIFLLTSRIEGLPNVLIESQYMGVPVVTTDAGGAVETLVHGETGWVLKENDSHYAALKLNALFKDKEWLSRAGEHGRDFVKEKFSLEKMMFNYKNLYQLSA